MAFMDSLPKAEKQGKTTSQRTQQQWHNVERRLHARKPVQPCATPTSDEKTVPDKSKVTHLHSADPMLNDELEEAHDLAAADEKPLTPIISIDGRDVKAEDIERPVLKKIS